jgi:hypothetical protein
MATSRAQLEQQIQRLALGGTASSAPQVLEVNPTTPPAAPMSVQDQIAELEKLLRESSSAKKNDPVIEIPDFDESFEKYQTRLRGLYGQTSRPSLYDLASTVGGAMLSADPTMGAFRSAGLGMAQFGKEQAALKQKRAEQDRAIGLKAFEMAKTDVDSATSLINEYRLLRAKEKPDNKVTEMLVTNPEGIVVSGVFYESGSRPLLTESEIYANRPNLENVSTPATGWKVTDAGAVGMYQSRADAEKTIEGLGLTRESPYFESAVQQLIPNDPSMIGKRIVTGGRFTELRPLVQGDKVFNVMLNTASGEKTNFAQYSEKRIEIIAKNNSAYVDKALTLLPEVERALMLLKGGTETGKLIQLTFDR